MKRINFLFSLFVIIFSIGTIELSAQHGAYINREDTYLDKDFFRVKPDFYVPNEDGVVLAYKLDYNVISKATKKRKLCLSYNESRNGNYFVENGNVILMYHYDNIRNSNYKYNYKGYKTIKVPSTIKINNKIYKVTSIGNSAFKGSEYVEKIILPETIEYIWDGAFSKMPNLTYIKFPSTIRYMESYMIGADLPKLKYIKLPSIIKSLYNLGVNVIDENNHLSVVEIDKTWSNRNIFDLNHRQSNEFYNELYKKVNKSEDIDKINIKSWDGIFNFKILIKNE